MYPMLIQFLRQLFPDSLPILIPAHMQATCNMLRCDMTTATTKASSEMLLYAALSAGIPFLVLLPSSQFPLLTAPASLPPLPVRVFHMCGGLKGKISGAQEELSRVSDSCPKSVFGSHHKNHNSLCPVCPEAPKRTHHRSPLHSGNSERDSHQRKLWSNKKAFVLRSK